LPLVADAFGVTFVWATIFVAIAFIPALLLRAAAADAAARRDDVEVAPAFIHV